MSCILCNPQEGTPNLISGKVSYLNGYGYLVDITSVYVFLSLFSLLAIAHLGLGIWRRKWWTLATIFTGCGVEVIGWSGRLLSTRTKLWNPLFGGSWSDRELGRGYLIQICCLIIAPTFYSAGNYWLFGILARTTRGRYTSISLRTLFIGFVIADVVCLVIQGAGGGIAASTQNVDILIRGLRIMASGVILQMIITFIYCGALAEFIIKLRRGLPPLRPEFIASPMNEIDEKDLLPSTPHITPLQPTESGNVKNTQPSPTWIISMLGIMITSTIFIIARGVYRCIELLTYNGDPDSAYSDQPLFIALDPSLMVILAAIYLAVHLVPFQRK